MDSKKIRRHWMACLSLAAFAGCATFQDAHYECSQRWRTETAWLEYWWCNPEWNGSDYKKGWQAGYLDVLTGGDGAPPLVAPHEYWTPSQIIKDCDQRRHDWYVGFQDGAMMAANLPDTHYIKLWNPPPVGHVGLAPTNVYPVETSIAPSIQPIEPQPKLQPAPAELPVPVESQPLPKQDGPVEKNLPPFPASYQTSPGAFPEF